MTSDANSLARKHGPDALREAIDHGPPIVDLAGRRGDSSSNQNDEELANKRTGRPRPLMRELPPAEPFPIDALGSVLGSAALAIHDRVRAPIAIGAQSVLAFATLATQAHVNVVLPIGRGTAKPLSSYFLTIAESGERKSESDKQASWPLRQHEKTLRAEYDAALPNYENDRAAWEKVRESAIGRLKSDRTAMKQALDEIGPAPQAPLSPMLTFGEPTYVGLVKLFARGQPSLGLFSTEGGNSSAATPWPKIIDWR